MSVAAAPRTVRIAVVGNPNTGKSTLFNALAGMNARVGNYPGVTVEKKIGFARWDDWRVELIDLPGTYSLSPRSQDELVAVEVLLGILPHERNVDVVICVADASNLERHLFLFSQILDIGKPAVLVLNMADSAEAAGLRIDVAALQAAVGTPVILTSANSGRGLDGLKIAVRRALEQKSAPRPAALPAQVVEATRNLFVDWTHPSNAYPYYLYERALLDVGGEAERFLARNLSDKFATDVTEARGKLIGAGVNLETIEAESRYAWARGVTDQVVTRDKPAPATRLTDRVDAVVTHWLLGPAIFLVTMFLIFQAIFTWATPLVEACEWLQGFAASFVEASLPIGPLRSLIVDGVIGGVGSVIVFLPQIAILFLFIALLEDSGYMPRAANMMDRLMAAVGLSGKSFLPLMSSFACAIPGVMATRVIDNYRDRMITILVAPLMSCSARLPVYVLFIEAFVPERRFVGFDVGGTSWTIVGLQGTVMFLMIFLGAIVAVPVAAILRSTFFRGLSAPFVMELPEYRLPSLRVVFSRVFEQCQAFVVRAGTLIFATTILIWAAGYFPADRSVLNSVERRLETFSDRIVAFDAGELDADDLTEEEKVDAATFQEFKSAANQLRGELLEKSFLGMAGHAIEPVVAPLGWDWRIGVATIASFPAREVIIGTMGTIFSLGGDVDEADEGLRGKLHSATRKDGSQLVTLPVALSVMVFFALCAQCASTLMVIYRETNSWRWPVFCFAYMTALAYVGALLTYQIGSRLLA